MGEDNMMNDAIDDPNQRNDQDPSDKNNVENL